jgi:hypothetical protein
LPSTILSLTRLHFEPIAVAALAVAGINEKDRAPITKKVMLRFIGLIQPPRNTFNKVQEVRFNWPF